MYKIIHDLKSDKYIVKCEIQDGTETWTENTRAKAIGSLISVARTLNGSYIREDDIEFLEMKRESISTNSISLEDAQLLDQIRRGEKVVLNFNDPRVRYRLTDEECDWVIQRREQPDYWLK